MSASKKEQATRVKKHVVRRQKGTMAAAPKSHVHVKKLTVEEGVRSKYLSLSDIPELVGGSVNCSVTCPITDFHCDFQQELSGV